MRTDHSLCATESSLWRQPDNSSGDREIKDTRIPYWRLTDWDGGERKMEESGETDGIEVMLQDKQHWF